MKYSEPIRKPGAHRRIQLIISLLCLTFAIAISAIACGDASPRDGEETARGTATVQPAGVVTRGDSGRAEIALTFDTGTGAGDVARVLAVLRDANVRATFAVTGLWAEEQRALLLAIAADGHQIINRGYHGVSFTGVSTGGAALPAAERTSQLSRTETTVFRLSGRSTRPYVRAPYGDIDDTFAADVARAGYGTIVLWSIDASDDRGASMDGIAASVVADVASGDIVRFDASGASAAIDALAAITAGLRANGLALVTAGELLRE